MFDTLRSAYRFFAMYADLEGWRHDEGGSPARPESERPLIDRWLLGRTDAAAEDVRGALADYDLTGAARTISAYVQDDLSNWYIRLTRERFWATRGGEAGAQDTIDAFATLHHALVVVCRLLAPIAPFLPDWVHRELVGDSVHLADFPGASKRVDPSLEQGMEDVRRLATLGRAAREEAGIRVRQPLGELRAVLPGGRRLDDALVDLLRAELNVRSVVFPAADDDIIRLSAKPDFGVLGPRFGPETPAVASAIGGLEGPLVRRLREGEAILVDVAGRQIEVRPDEVEIFEQAAGDLVVQAEDGWLVGLDTTLDDDLRAEGFAREIVNRVQRLRRDADLAVSDRIRLAVAGAPEIERIVSRHEAYIGGETLAVTLAAGRAAVDALAVARDVEIDGEKVRIGLEVTTDAAGVREDAGRRP
jgi:isoleucyl-tRNA synthetase